MEWFAVPEYPDGDPLLVRINKHGPSAQAPNVLSLDEIDPCRVMYELTPQNMFMMRVEGVDVSPVFE